MVRWQWGVMQKTNTPAIENFAFVYKFFEKKHWECKRGIRHVVFVLPILQTRVCSAQSNYSSSQSHRNTCTPTTTHYPTTTSNFHQMMQTLGHMILSSFLRRLRGFEKSSLLQAGRLHAAAEVQQCGGRGPTRVPGLHQPKDQPDILPQRHRWVL
jgi:peroxiredoxin